VQKLYSKPFLAFLPFLVLYAVLIIIQNDNSLFGDEGRYLMFAENLLHGFYSPPPPHINLWNGPGFPIYLVPFVALNAPLLFIKLFNAVLHYFTLVLFFKTLLNFLDDKKSFVCTVILGCYYMPFKGFPHILSETFTIFFVGSISFLTFRFFSATKQNLKSYFLLAFMLAFLALTKVIFGIVYLIAGIVFLVLYFIRRNIDYRNSFLLMTLSLIFSLPYLMYTYSLTGRFFYWSNAAGMSMYWMTNPAEGEYGEWYDDSLSSAHLDNSSKERLLKNHGAEYEKIYSLDGVARDDKFKSFAIQHIKQHPGKFFMNWLANISRMFFNYPAGYKSFTIGTAFNMLANIPLLILLLYSYLLTWKKKKEIPFAIKFLLIGSFIYLAGTSILSAYDRMLYILIPVFGCWIAYSVFKLARIENA